MKCAAEIDCATQIEQYHVAVSSGKCPVVVIVIYGKVPEVLSMLNGAGFQMQEEGRRHLLLSYTVLALPLTSVNACLPSEK